MVLGRGGLTICHAGRRIHMFTSRPGPELSSLSDVSFMSITCMMITQFFLVLSDLSIQLVY